MLDFLVSQAVRNKCLFFKLPRIWYIVIAAWDHPDNKWHQEVEMLLYQIPKNVDVALARVMGRGWKSAFWTSPHPKPWI